MFAAHLVFGHVCIYFGISTIFSCLFSLPQLERALDIALVLGRVKLVTALEDFRKRRAAGGVRRKSKKKANGGAGGGTNANEENLLPARGRPNRKVIFDYVE
jgi:hypothetical protein